MDYPINLEGLRNCLTEHGVPCHTVKQHTAATLMLRTLRAGGRVALADFVLVPNDNGTFVVESHEVSKEVVL